MVQEGIKLHDRGKCGLALQRAPSFYGDEYRKTPARKLFKKEDAERALDTARKVINLVRKLYHEWIT
jgi:HEPN domain-containing protein